MVQLRILRSIVCVWVLLIYYATCVHGQVVRYSTEVTDLATGSVVTDAVVGGQYLLTTFVDSPGLGVFAAYTDVQYDPDVFQVTGPIMHGVEYGSRVNGDVTTQGRILGAGGIGSLSTKGPGVFEVFRIEMEAIASHPIDIRLGAPEDQSQNETLRYGFNEGVPISCIDFGTGQTDFSISCGSAQRPFGSNFPGLVRYSTALTDMNGDEVSDVVAGDRYELIAFTKDITPASASVNPDGVFAAYIDVQFDPMRLQVDGLIVHGAEYNSSASGDTTLPGRILGAGGIGSLSAKGPGTLEIFRIPLMAVESGPIDIMLAPPTDQTQQATFRYGLNDVIPLDCIDFGTGRTDFPLFCTQIVPEPSGTALLVTGLLALGPLSRRKSRRARRVSAKSRKEER